ncbi:unnamed protein product [Debaryomyces tyrocola]|nr:unnamed protein product [Debaryomyces tyrocola]
MIQPNIIHMLTRSNLNTQYSEVVFGIGDYKRGIYKMTQGFEEFKTAILNRRILRLHSIGNFFSGREWSPRVLFALVLSKYIYQSFLFGTDRILISEHQRFSGFFRYELVDGVGKFINKYNILRERIIILTKFNFPIDYNDAAFNTFKLGSDGYPKINYGTLKDCLGKISLTLLNILFRTELGDLN